MALSKMRVSSGFLGQLARGTFHQATQPHVCFRQTRRLSMRAGDEQPDRNLPDVEETMEEGKREANESAAAAEEQSRGVVDSIKSTVGSTQEQAYRAQRAAEIRVGEALESAASMEKKVEQRIAQAFEAGKQSVQKVAESVQGKSSGR